MMSDWRVEVRLVPGGQQLMRSLMKIQGLTVLELARRCGSEKHRSAIGHLLSGKRSTCSDELANKLQRELLGKAAGDMRLFVPRVSRVTQDSRTPGRVAA